MTLPAWPTELPPPSRKSWNRTWQDPRRRRTAEAGPPGYRRRFSSAAQLISMQVDLTRVQRSVFENFYEVTTKHGSLSFTMPDPTTDGWPLLTSDERPILTESDVPILVASVWTCLFGPEPPRERHYGTRFVIDFSVAVMP